MNRHAFLLLLVSINGLSGTILGALGAHALEKRLVEAGNTSAWETAGQYQLIHVACSLALLVWADCRCESAKNLHRAVIWWQVGCVVFSGSIYILALGGPRFFGPITPLGGLALMVGWATLAVHALRLQPRPSS